MTVAGLFVVFAVMDTLPQVDFLAKKLREPSCLRSFILPTPRNKHQQKNRYSQENMSSNTINKNKRTAIDAGLPTTAGPAQKNRKLIEEEMNQAEEAQLKEEWKQLEENLEETKKRGEEIKEVTNKDLNLQLGEGIKIADVATCQLSVARSTHPPFDAPKKKSMYIFDNSSTIH